MFTWSIGTQTINTTPVLRSLDAQHRPKDSDAKVAIMGKILSTPHRTSFQREEKSLSFSPLRFLWWVSLLVGARAQLTNPFPASMNLSAFSGTNGFVLNGEQTNDYNGNSVANAGDVNGDQIADLLIGSFGANSYAGKSYVVFGRVGLGSNGSLALSSLDGANGFVLIGEQASDKSGFSVASAGDVNGDNIADLLIGASIANSYVGKSYVVFGRKLSNATFMSTLTSSSRLATSTLSTFAQSIPPTTLLTTDSNSLTGASVSTSLNSTLGPTDSTPLSFTLRSTNALGPTTLPSSISTSARSASSPTSANSFSQPTKSFLPVTSAHTSESLPLIIGVALAVAALSYGIIGAGIYFLKRKRKSKNSAEEGVGFNGMGVLPTSNPSIEAIPQVKASSRDKSDYLNLPGIQSQRHYSNPSDVQQPRDGEQYDQVSLTQLNAQVDQDEKVQLSTKEKSGVSSQPKSTLGGKRKGHYSDLKNVGPQTNQHYLDQESLAQLNQELAK